MKSVCVYDRDVCMPISIDHSIIIFSLTLFADTFVCVDFDVDLSSSPTGAVAMSTPTYRALASNTDAGRQTTRGAVARTQSPRYGARSPAADRWKPLSVETYNTELRAHVQQSPASTSGSVAGRDSPRPLVFDIELGRRLPDDEDDFQPLQQLTTMPRPDTPSNVWSVAET